MEKDPVGDFLDSYGVKSNKFRANAEIMQHQTKEIYQAINRRGSGPDLSGETTPTIEWMANRLNQPLGYPIWFMTAFPDVVLWASQLQDSKLQAIFDDPAGGEVIIDEKISTFYLRKLTDFYVAEGHDLETV